jgi:hypothetical protein
VVYLLCVPKTLYGALVLGHSLSRAIFILFHVLRLLQFFCSARGGAILPPRPLVPSAVARSGRSRRAPSSGPPRQRRGVSLTAASIGRMRRPGATHFASLVRQLRPLIATSQRGRDLGLMCDTASCSRATKSEASSLLVLR